MARRPIHPIGGLTICCTRRRPAFMCSRTACARHSSTPGAWSVASNGDSRWTGRDPVTLRWFTAGSLVTADAESGVPLLLLGADGYGRDIFSRLLYGARATLAVSLVSALLATVLGACVGGVAGYVGGWFDSVLSRVSEFVLVLPAIYVALVLRAVLPLVLPRVHRVCAPDWDLHSSGLADRRARRARDRACRTGARVRRGRTRSRCQRRTAAAASSAASGGRLPEDAGLAARAGVHARRGHPLVCRPRISQHHSDLGNDAPGRIERHAARRRAVVTGAGRGNCSRSSSASICWRRAKAGPRYNWSHEAIHRHLHAHHHAVSIGRHASTKPGFAAT